MPNDTIFTLIENLKDPKSLEIKDKIEKISMLNTNLLLCGETGVGKDFWANFLQTVSSSPHLVNLHCGDVPENLLESEWFGHRKGAYTGADRDFAGRWRKAENGILFLNQIDLLSVNLQARLLRIIERKKYFSLGSNQEVNIKVRFIFSVDADIEDRVQKGLFRQDLYYRISAYKVNIPPLRERKADILPLLHYFAGQKKLEVKLDSKSIQQLLSYPWKGNIRELENFVGAIAVSGKELTSDDVQAMSNTPSIFYESLRDTDLSLPQLEKQYIDHLLSKYKNKSRVAKILKISRKTLYNILNRNEKS